MFDPGYFARRVEVLIEHHRFDAARSVIGEAERAAVASRRGLSVEEKLELPLADTSLPPKVINKLDEHGIITVRDLAETSRTKLRSIPNIGTSTLKQLLGLLDRLGVSELV